MTLKQLIKRLNEIIEANPKNVDIEIKWWDSFHGYFVIGDGFPIQLFYYPIMNKTYCVINAVDKVPGCYVAIPDKGKKDIDNRMANC